MAEALKNDEPVVLSEDEQVAALEQSKTPLTEAEIATQALSAKEEAAKTVEDLPTKDGIPRISIAPVSPQPKANVEETKTRVDLMSRPPYIRTQTKELKPAVEQEVERRAAMTEPMTYNSVMEKLEAGETVTLGNKTYRPQVLNIIKSNQKERMLLKGQVAQYGKPQAEAAPTEPSIMFTDPSATKVVIPPSITNPDEIDLATNYAEGRIAVNNMLKQTIPDRNVRQIIVDNYISGDFMQNLAQRVAEQGRGIPGIGTLLSEAYGVLEALDDTLPPGTKFTLSPEEEAKGKGLSFSEAWESRRAQREQRRQKYLEGVDTVLSGPTLAMHFNNEVNRIAKERFEAGTLTEDQYKALAFDTVGGKEVPKVHFDEDTAYQLMDLAFNEMPEVSQVGVIIAENVATGGFFSASKASRSKQELAKLKKMIAADKTLENLSYNDVVRVLKERDTRVKINNKLLQVGIAQETVSDQLSNATKAIQKSNEKLSKMRLDGLENTASYKLELSNRDNIQRLKNRAYISGKATPYLTAGVSDVFVTSLGQYFAREQLGEVMDPGAAEAVGFLGMSLGLTKGTKYLGKKVAGAATSVVGFTGRTALRVVPEMLGTQVTLVGRLANKAIPLGDTTVNDYERLVFMPANNGRRMTMGERAAMARTVKQVQELSPENRERLFAAIERVEELKENILRGFPDEASRLQAEKLFNMSLGQAAGISLTAAARADGTLSLKTINKEGLNSLFDATAQQQRQIEQTKVALDAFANYVSQFPEVGNKAPIKRMMSGMQNMVLEQEALITRDLKNIDANLDEFIEAASADILEGVDESFINDLRDMKIALKSELNEVIDEEQALKEVNRAWAKGTERRLDRIKNLRNNRLRHRSALSRLLEDMAYARLNQLTARGDAAYARLNKFIEETDRPGIDISEAVEDMMSIAGESDIMQMFGRDGYFFSSPVGRRAQQVFNSMANKAFDAIDPDYKTFLEAKLVEAGLPESMVAGMSNVDFALAAHATGELNIFANVTLTEADVMRRAFRDYGYKVKNSNPAVGGRFKEFANKLDSLIENADKEGYEKLLEAREEYAAAVGDTQREGGTFYKLKQSRKGGEKKAVTDDAPTMYYYRGFRPDNLFDDIINPLDKLMRQRPRNKEQIVDQLRNAVEDTAQAFADPVNGSLVFNLDDPDSLQAFNLLRRAVTESIQGRWFDDYIKAVRKERVGSRIGPESTYDFARSEDIATLNDATTITVTQGGVSKQVPLADMTSLYRFEQFQLADLEKGTQLAKAFKDFQTRASQTLRRVKNAEEEASVKRGNAMVNLKVLANVNDGQQFFDKYIEGVGADIDVLRDVFINSAKEQNIEATEAEKLFDEGVKALTFQGLLARGGYSVSPEAVEKAFDGTEYAAKTLTNTGALLETMNRPEVRQNLLSMFDQEHIDYIDSIASYLHIEAARELVLSGGTKGLSTQEALSRAYNIARGMVSPLYVGSEVAIRIMQEMNAETLFMALDNKDSARIMDKILNFPKLVTREELDTFDTMLMTFMATHALRTGQEATVRKYLDVNPFDEETTDETNTEGQ
jgi:hypothetical protein